MFYNLTTLFARHGHVFAVHDVGVNLAARFAHWGFNGHATALEFALTMSTIPCQSGILLIVGI
jgi:hypothetical protein